MIKLSPKNFFERLRSFYYKYQDAFLTTFVIVLVVGALLLGIFLVNEKEEQERHRPCLEWCNLPPGIQECRCIEQIGVTCQAFQCGPKTEECIRR